MEITEDKKTIGKKLNILIHILCWGLLLHLVFDFVGLYYSFYSLFVQGSNFIDDAFLLIPLMLGLFYGNSHFLLPKLLSKRKVLFYLIGLVSIYLIYVSIGYSIYLLFIYQGYYFWIEPDEILDIFIFSGILVIGVSTSVGLVKIMQENTLQKKMAEEERKKAELKYLSAQVNPHFLFNTLNAIYSLSTEENAPKTTEAVLKLSEIMRYPINEGTQQWNLLSKEIKFIQDYIDLQKIRLGTEYPILFEIKGEVAEKKVAPFLFIPLVENAFKYGISRQNPTPIIIKLQLLDDSLIFTVKNSKTQRKDFPSTKLGIQNLKERLKIIYPEKFELIIEEKEDRFYVRLKIEI